jgi:hypothetical protein
VEPLRVPISTVPGNHDYRKHPYHLIFDVRLDLQIFGIDVKRITEYSGYNLGKDDAIALWHELHSSKSLPAVLGAVPNLDVDEAAQMLAIDPSIRAYRECLADRASYVVQLGDHRIILLDSAHDIRVLTSVTEALRHLLLMTNEDEATFAGGSPNCEVISDDELLKATAALAATPVGGLVMVALHAPCSTRAAPNTLLPLPGRRLARPRR